ncbi:HD domain-containing protein [Aquisalibacillus elongatus]|uniref:HD domain-containing protein n=1 Tax=Aquisalibacillus elongatus TaxID=485577 RepID=A0A3N5B850_9BACI|nr:HD domain-containing protein [Aquisalibacillus elongatus]RPF53916.1 hypothetical protein EDC24_1101 [Aquisalibacillus elongatus]
MYINHELYGEFQVENVLEEIILSKPVQRLKEVHQNGAGYLVNPKWNVSRYDHSIGVMLLIRKLGGSIEEQIAGLLHDVSHTAFSHVIDVVLDYKGEDYHEEIFNDVVKNSEIPSILDKYGYRYEKLLLDDSKWTILEQPQPDLCADRVDYTLLDMYHHGVISYDEVQAFLDDLTIVNGKMHLTRVEVAEWFCQTYYHEVIDFFLDPRNIFCNQRLAQTLKLALEKGIIQVEDFLGQDEELIELLRASGVQEVLSLLESIHPDVEVEVCYDDYDFYHQGKLRLIDPAMLIDGKSMRASDCSENVTSMNQVAYEQSIQGVGVRIG